MRKVQYAITRLTKKRSERRTAARKEAAFLVLVAWVVGFHVFCIGLFFLVSLCLRLMA